MGTRIELAQVLEGILAEALSLDDAHNRVYFQPPETVKMVYPCIVYTLDHVNTKYANNFPYRHRKRYAVIVIDRNPDSIIPDKVANLPLCSFSRKFTNDNLNHFLFEIYY